MSSATEADDSVSVEHRIAACRAATKAYREAYKLAAEMTAALKAEGLCGTCAVGDHAYCRDYGCKCCGGGK